MKRLFALIFVISVFTVTPIEAQSVPKPPRWLVERVKAGERCKALEPDIRRVGLPVMYFTYIAYRESRCREKAVNAKWDKQGNIVWTLNRNGTYDSGLFQINSSWRTVTREECGGGLDRLLNARCNLKMAVRLYSTGGLGHWGF